MNSVKYSGQNVSAVKAQNIKAILMNLLFHEPVYRVDLAKDISVSTTTVTKLVDELMEQGVILEGQAEENAGRPVGRPKSALFLNSDAYYAVGIHIGGRRFRIGVVNLRDEIIHFYKGEYDFTKPWKPLFDEISLQLEKMLSDSEINREKIIGIGIGAPGLVDFNTGVIGYSKNHGWREVPVERYFCEKFGLPVIVENNVRAMALGEALFGSGRGVDNLLFLYGSRGVGAGLVVNRDVYRGISQGAGEIGHTFILQKNGSEKIIDDCLTLEELVSIPSIITRAKKIAENNPSSEFTKKTRNLEENDLIDRVFQLARDNDPLAENLVQRIGQYLGLALVNAINFVNPELILLGGLFAEHKDLFLPPIRTMVDDLTFANIGKKVDIRATEFGWQAGLIGAGALALAHFFYLPPKDAGSILENWSGK